jgi:glycerol-3-phosphate acyltransferase PlsX
MSAGITIAIDAMSGDDGPDVVVPAALAYLQKKIQADSSGVLYAGLKHESVKNKAFNIILVGDQEKLEALLRQAYHKLDKAKNSHLKASVSRTDDQDSASELSPLAAALSEQLSAHISILHAESVVEMDDRPSLAFRQKRDSSMAQALELVRAGKADACVSAGNTGALMMLGRAILGTYPGIDRPAITKMFPSQGGGTFVLDLGANVDSSAEHLLQFAIMGQLLAKIIKGVESPKVALLNVGGESIKGNEQVRLAASLIEEHALINYVGFAEGGDIFRSKADVIVCDGFVGNVALKSAEGAAKILLKEIKDFFEASWYRKLIGFLLLPLLKKHLKQLDPDTHNGAIFLGLQGVLVKSHGHASVQSFEHAIDLAVQEAEAKLPEMINQQLEALLF